MIKMKKLKTAEELLDDQLPFVPSLIRDKYKMCYEEISHAMKEYAEQFIDYAAMQIFNNNKVNPLSNKETVESVKELIK